MAEVGVGGSGTQDQVVVIDGCATPQLEPAGSGVDGDDFFHKYLGIRVLAHDGADGLGDLGRREHGERHLVEQRLEGMVITAVDHGYVHRQLAQGHGCVDAGESASDDGDTWPAPESEWLTQLAHDDDLPHSV